MKTPRFLFFHSGGGWGGGGISQSLARAQTTDFFTDTAAILN